MHNYVTGSGKNNNFAYLFSIIIIAVKVTKLGLCNKYAMMSYLVLTHSFGTHLIFLGYTYTPAKIIISVLLCRSQTQWA